MSLIEAMKYLLIFSILLQNVFISSALSEHLLGADISYGSLGKERECEML